MLTEFTARNKSSSTVVFFEIFGSWEIPNICANMQVEFSKISVKIQKIWALCWVRQYVTHGGLSEQQARRAAAGKVSGADDRAAAPSRSAPVRTP